MAKPFIVHHITCIFPVKWLIVVREYKNMYKLHCGDWVGLNCYGLIKGH